MTNQEILSIINSVPNAYSMGKVMDQFNLLNEGVEVGVLAGAWTVPFLEMWNGKCLYSVDCWEQQSGDAYKDPANIATNEQEKLYRGVMEKTKPFGKKSQIHRLYSLEASKLFKNEQLDFVYLDANHGTDPLIEDIKAWYPKIRNGGILCGDDWGWGSVRDAVCSVFGLDIIPYPHLTSETEFRNQFGPNIEFNPWKFYFDAPLRIVSGFSQKTIYVGSGAGNVLQWYIFK